MFFESIKDLMLQPHRTMHWLIPTLEHVLPNNLLRIRAVAKNGIQCVQESGPLPHHLNEILDILITRLKPVGTKLNLPGVSLT